MKIILINIILTLVIKTSTAQNLEKNYFSQYNEQTEDPKHKGQHRFYIMPNGDKVDLIWGGNDIGYIEQITPNNSLITLYNVYHINGVLKSSTKLLNNSFFFGKEVIHDHIGNVIKEIDHDKSFKYNIYDVAKRIKEEFNVDLFTTEKEIRHLEVNRLANKESDLAMDGIKYNLYIINIPITEETEDIYIDNIIKKNNFDRVRIDIDADTGKEIDRMKYFGGLDNGEAYLKAFYKHRTRKKQ